MKIQTKRRTKTMADKTAIADSIYNSVQQIVSKIHIVDGLDISSARAVVDIQDAVLTEIEKLDQGNLNELSRDDRRDIAVDVISRLITIDVSWIPNFIENKAKHYIVSSLVEYTISLLDKKLGKNW